MTAHLPPEILIDYIHGELHPAEDAQVHAHLSSCAFCHQQLEHERALTELLRSAAAREDLEFPPLIKARVWQTIRAAKPSLWAWLRSPNPLAPALAATLAIGAFTAGMLLQGSHAHPTIDAAFYLDEHAEQQGSSPLAERSAPQTIESAYDQTQTEGIAAPDDALLSTEPYAIF